MNVDILQNIMHYNLHFLVFPGLVAYIASRFFDQNWKQVFVIILLTMLVDLDHLFATPIFDPHRCSVGFHFLHSYYAIVLYWTFLIFKRTRLVGIGLLLHMLTDLQDCLWVF